MVSQTSKALSSSIIEAVVAGDDLLHLVLREEVVGGPGGLIVDEGDGVAVMILALEGEESAHHLKGM